MKQIKDLKRIYKPGILACLVIFSSCSKGLLDTVPNTNISDATAFDTPDRIASQVNGLYAGSKNTYLYGGRYAIYNELRADEFLISKPDPGQSANVWSHTINSGSTEVINLWTAGYNTINRVNTFIAGLEEHKSVISDALFTQYIAEAKFIRAIAYFALVQVYAKPFNLDNGASPGLPLRLLREGSGANNNLARSPVADIYKQILDDLNAAETGLPANYQNAFTNATKANKSSAIAFKTRVYLNKGDYANAKTEAVKIVNPATISSPSGAAHSLEASVATVFNGSYSGPEAVLSMPYTTANSGSQLSYYFIATGSGYYLNPSGVLADPALNNVADARSALVVTVQGRRWLNKFKTPAPLTDYVPVIRYAEVVLNYAEAAARTNDLTTAATLLKAVRKRADATYTFAAGDLTNQAALIGLILNERRIELMGEGFRTMDLQRLVLPIAGKVSPEGISPALAVTSSLYIWPISSEEIGINKLASQN